MSDSTEALRRAWVARVLGVQLPSLASGALPPKGTVTTASPTGTPQVHTGPDGRRLEVVVGPDGRTELRCPKPPLREITFSGGGGKGTALAGAVRALEESGTLADVHEIHGASVGSISASPRSWAPPCMGSERSSVGSKEVQLSARRCASYKLASTCRGP